MMNKPFIHDEKGFFVEVIPCFGHGLPPSRLALCPLSATWRVCTKKVPQDFGGLRDFNFSCQKVYSTGVAEPKLLFTWQFLNHTLPTVAV